MTSKFEKVLIALNPVPYKPHKKLLEYGYAMTPKEQKTSRLMNTAIFGSIAAFFMGTLISMVYQQTSLVMNSFGLNDYSYAIGIAMCILFAFSLSYTVYKSVKRSIEFEKTKNTQEKLIETQKQEPKLEFMFASKTNKK